MTNSFSLEEQEIEALLLSIKKLSDWFWGPDRQKCDEMLTSDYWHCFLALETQLKFDLPEAVKKIITDLKNFKDADSFYNFLETAYVRLFISHRNGIAAPLYESCYHGVGPGDRGSLMGEPALKMKQRFESKGLSLDFNIHEPPDHLAIELEYLYFLLSKGREDQDGTLIAEAGSFAAGTMLPWVSDLQTQVELHLPDHPYCHMVSILKAVLRRIGELEKKNASLPKNERK